MEKVHNTETWIEKALSVHGNKYDYNNVTYNGSKNKVEIICPTHGSFFQKASDHLSGYGCKECGKKMTNKEFIQKAKQVHGDKYDYDNSIYDGLKKDVKIICPKHGEFTTKAGIHLKGFNCPKCSLFGNEQFIKKAQQIHSQKYDYQLVDYKNAHTKVKIICPEHGIFEQRASAHTDGQGCPNCNRQLNKFKRSVWNKLNEGKVVTFYVIRCWNDSESFIKIGITKNFTNRYNSHKKMPYNFETITTINSEDTDYIWNIEKELISLCKNHKYRPLIKFGGSRYECFTTEVIGIISANIK